MIYIDNIFEPLMVPVTDSTAPAPVLLLITDTVSLKTYSLRVASERVGGYLRCFITRVPVHQPEAGEYQYALVTNGKPYETGLLRIGAAAIDREQYTNLPTYEENI